jgi:uncharacterized repeat protein (TIGR03837 family)
MGKRCDIFCNVIDNYGDIGIAWRLARQLLVEHGLPVRLWVDELGAFHRIRRAIDPHAAAQLSDGVEIRVWPRDFALVEPADVVIEAFGCAIPQTYLEAMAARTPAPLWINLEYLSAEPWVRDHHGLPSPHPRLPLLKYFFFPGYEPGTGGLLRERELAARRERFRRDEAAAFWHRLGIAPAASGTERISLFAYENAAIAALLDAWAAGETAVECLIPEGRILPQVAAWAGRTGLAAGEEIRRGRLTLCILPFLDQDDYDRLLWACDVNFVRGEDSCVRAQWAGRPMVWQAYPQADEAHWNKVEALLERYCEDLPSSRAAVLAALWRGWNGIDGRADMARAWAGFRMEQDAIARHALSWSERLAALGDLAGNLVDFIENSL